MNLDTPREFTGKTASEAFEAAHAAGCLAFAVSKRDGVYVVQARKHAPR